MQHAVQFVAFLTAAYGVAIGSWSILRHLRFVNWVALCVGAAVIVLPIIVASDHVTLRALGCVLAIDLFFKITDYANEQRNRINSDQRFVSYVCFLVPFPVLLVRFAKRPRRLQQLNGTEWHTALLALFAFGICFILLMRLASVPILQSSFLLDHTVKFVLFAVAIEFLARSICSLEHIAGYNTKPLVNNAFISRTVGEFWYRYNTRVHSWFNHNVFRPMNGLRSPVRAVFGTFFVSAVLHEIGFAIATSRLDGYQFTFFMIQAPAVILGRHVSRTGTASAFAKIAARPMTIVWMWASSMLFFHGVNRVFPFFYAASHWLP